MPCLSIPELFFVFEEVKEDEGTPEPKPQKLPVDNDNGTEKEGEPKEFQLWTPKKRNRFSDFLNPENC